MNTPVRLLTALVALAGFAWASGDAGAATPTGVSSELEQTASTTPEEKIAYAASALQEIQVALTTIDKLLNQQKAKGGEGSTDAINCLRLKYTSVLALNDVAQSASVSMQSAIDDDNEELANHEYRKIAVAVAKTRQLLAEAQTCASDGTVSSGTTIVDWESALDNPDDLKEPEIIETNTTPAPPDVTPFQ
jgi:hypothetical protein